MAFSNHDAEARARMAAAIRAACDEEIKKAIAEEREACAKECDECWDDVNKIATMNEYEIGARNMAMALARAIRARGSHDG